MMELSESELSLMAGAFALMEGLKGAPRGADAMKRRATAFWGVLCFRKCADGIALTKASERFANEFDEFPTSRSYADMVQACMGNKTHIVDPVYIAESGYVYVVERAYAHHNGLTIHANHESATNEALLQPHKFAGTERDMFDDSLDPADVKRISHERIAAGSRLHQDVAKMNRGNLGDFL